MKHVRVNLFNVHPDVRIFARMDKLNGFDITVLGTVSRASYCLNDLALMFETFTTTISRSVDKLLHRQFVTVSKEQHDKRRHIITITPAGLAFWRELVSKQKPSSDAHGT